MEGTHMLMELNWSHAGRNSDDDWGQLRLLLSEAEEHRAEHWRGSLNN